MYIDRETRLCFIAFAARHKVKASIAKPAPGSALPATGTQHQPLRACVAPGSHARSQAHDARASGSCVCVVCRVEGELSDAVRSRVEPELGGGLRARARARAQQRVCVILRVGGGRRACARRRCRGGGRVKLRLSRVRRGGGLGGMHDA